MKRIALFLTLALAFCAPQMAVAQNAPSNSMRVQGVPDGYGDPLQVTVVTPNGADPTGANAQQVQITGPSGTTATIGNTAADGSSTNSNALFASSRGYVYNGVTWDRARGDTSGTWTNQTTSAAAGIGTPMTTTSAAASSLVLKASAANLYRVVVTSGASAGYVMIFNATSAPADGAVTPVDCRAIAANASLSISYADAPARLTTGATVVFSTTGCFTKTASATAFITGMAL